MLCFLIRCLTRKTIVKKHVSIVFLKLLDVLFQLTVKDVEQSLWMKVFRMEGDIFQVSWVKLSFLFTRDDSILCSDNLFHLLKKIIASVRLSFGLRFNVNWKRFVWGCVSHANQCLLHPKVSETPNLKLSFPNCV